MDRWDWNEIKPFADPIFAEIDQPEATLLRIEIVINDDESTDVGAAFLYEGQTPERNAALLDHAIELLTEHVAWRRGHPPGHA